MIVWKWQLQDHVPPNDTSVKDNFYEDSKSEQKHLKTAMDQNFCCRV